MSKGRGKRKVPQKPLIKSLGWRVGLGELMGISRLEACFLCTTKPINTKSTTY